MKKLLVLQQDESDSAWDVTGQSPVVVVVKGDRSVLAVGCVCVCPLIEFRDQKAPVLDTQLEL